MVISTIESLGFPIVAFVITIVTIIYLIGKEENRQALSDKRYDELTNKFIDTVKKISDENNKTLKELIDSIHDIVDKFDDPQKK